MLKELQNTVVNTKTQAEYDELMDIYEKAGWVWRRGDRPKDLNNWTIDNKSTCIGINNYFGYADTDWYRIEGYKILSLQEFKEIQGINELTADELYEYIKKHGITLCEIMEDFIPIPKGTKLYFGIYGADVSTCDISTENKNKQFGYDFDYWWLWSNNCKGKFKVIKEEKNKTTDKYTVYGKFIDDVHYGTITTGEPFAGMANTQRSHNYKPKNKTMSIGDGWITTNAPGYNNNPSEGSDNTSNKNKTMSTIKNIFKPAEDKIIQETGIEDEAKNLTATGRDEWIDYLYATMKEERKAFRKLIVDDYKKNQK